MIRKATTVLLSIIMVSLSGCVTVKSVIENEKKTRSDCYILYDAGSSGTRLFVYEKNHDNWLLHAGPKTSALADPVRQIRGKTHGDIDTVTSEVVTALEMIRQNGNFDSNGQAEWQAFDWQKYCNVLSVSVYATAGMRIAEQENRTKSHELWIDLEQKINQKMDAKTVVNVRTLTGFEEGLFAWLAVREHKQHSDFGVVEMGGASTQITFPCTSCNADDNAVKTVFIAGESLQIYSYSFLGLGQDEAPKTLGSPSSCAYGVGKIINNWKVADCAQKISFSDANGIRDPYNYTKDQLGAYRKIPISQADTGQWVLTGAFNYLKADQVDTCCHTAGQCYNESTSCFRAIYLDKYLQSLNIPAASEKMDVNWTLGAVRCAADDCMQKLTVAPVCRWSDKQCL